MSDASFTAAGKEIVVEDGPNQYLQSQRKLNQLVTLDLELPTLPKQEGIPMQKSTFPSILHSSTWTSYAVMHLPSPETDQYHVFFRMTLIPQLRNVCVFSFYKITLNSIYVTVSKEHRG